VTNQPSKRQRVPRLRFNPATNHVEAAMDEEHDLPPDVAAEVERHQTLRRRLRYDRASNTRPTARIEDEVDLESALAELRERYGLE
jgi:hypothetical protein